MIRNKYIFGALALVMLASCSDKKDDPKPSGDTVTVTFTTNVTINTKADLIKELTEGQEMNAYVKAFGSIDAQDLVSNVKAVNKAGTWNMTPEVKINKDQNAFIYAAYPYNEAATDPKAIPVDVTKQADVLYSGQFVPASFTTNHVKLNMKHALSMVALNIKKEGYSGEGLITGIAIEGKNIIATKGTMNVSSGKITPTEYGKLSVTGMKYVAGNDGISGALPAIWAIPFTVNDISDATVTVTIDGKEYKAGLPAIDMHTGWQYVFRAVLTQNGLVFVPNGVEEYALNRADDEMGPLEGYGVLNFNFSGTDFLFPAFTGDGIFGNVKTGSGKTVNFSIGGSLTGLSGNEVITVETWNTTGFEIRSFEGIDAIDMSGY